MVRGLPRAALASALLLAAGCVRTASSGDLAGFAAAAGKVHEQADVSFARANSVSRQSAIDAFVASRRPGISERAFPPALDADSISAWDAALSGLERYGQLLADLLDGGRGGRSSGAVAGLGGELRSGAVGARIEPGVAAGFAALAGVLVDASARASARSIMRDADPAVRRTLTGMASALGRDRTEGVQATVWSNWTASLGGIRDQYAAAAEKGDEARQRSLAAEFLSGVDRRDADLRTLTALRTSLLCLADAHAAAAAGSRPGRSAVVEGIDRRLENARRDINLLRGGDK